MGEQSPRCVVVRFQYNICFGSTGVAERLYPGKIEFQYNICFGSTPIAIDLELDIPYFNTTFVSVRLSQ